MAEEVFMDIPVVKDLGKRFEEIGNTLTKVSRMLEVAITVLKASAFVGLCGNVALASYLESLKPQIENFAKKCEEMASDVLKSVEAYERGDAQGATRFF